MQQPCSGEMQGMNSLINPQNGGHEQQHQHNHSQMHQNAPFDQPTSQDDFFEQMLSSLPSCSWTDIKSSPWVHDLNPKPTTANAAGARDLPEETPLSAQDNVAFSQFDDHQSMILASKMRQHQISGGGGDSTAAASAAAASAAAKLMQQQIMMARGAMGMPLTLGSGGDNDVVDGSSFKSQEALYNGFAGSLHGSATGQPPNQPPHFHHPQGVGSLQTQNYGGPAPPAMNQAPTQTSGSTGGTPGQPRQRVRARRGQATDPHSIAERLRRERIAERMKALQELVPNANKTDKASMLDEIIDYVKFLQLQVKVLSMSRLGGAGAVAPLVADISSEGGGVGDIIQTRTSGGSHARDTNGNQTASSNDSLTITEHQVAKLMEEDMGSAMQYLQGKGLCLMPISLATAISTATCHSRNPMVNSNNNNNNNPLLQSNGEGPSSPNMSVLTVQSATMGNGGNDASVKDAASVSKP